MQPYPAITQSDPMQQMLGQVMGGYKPNQLGAGVTLGNPEAQQDYVAQLAKALADSGAAGDLMTQSEGLQDSGWIDNSGIAGVAERMMSAYVSKKLGERARTQQADSETRRMNAEFELKDREAVREAARSAGITARERTQRESDARKYGLNNREAAEYILTGKLSAAPRGVPMMTDQGLVNVDPTTGEYEQARPKGQQARQQPQAPFQIEGDVPPEVRAAMQADPAAWENGTQIDIPEKRPLMPYKDPAIAANQAASNARADESLGLARRAADRADQALQFQQDQARKKDAAQDSQPNAMRQDAINFAAAYIGKSPEEVAKMTPEEIRGAVASGGRWMAGPVMGRIPGAGATFNADLDAYSSSAAAKLARINNPTGVVTNADFQAAEKGVFSATKPADVNADLIYQALTTGGSAKAPPAAPQDAGVDDLLKKYGAK